MNKFQQRIGYAFSRQVFSHPAYKNAEREAQFEVWRWAHAQMRPEWMRDLLVAVTAIVFYTPLLYTLRSGNPAMYLLVAMVALFASRIFRKNYFALQFLSRLDDRRPAARTEESPDSEGSPAAGSE